MRRYIYLTVFISGMITLAAEFAASRLLGNIFGTSNIVWASIIGLILIYLTLGYFLGGRWADKSPHPKTMFTILTWAAFSLGVVPFIAGPVLRTAATAFDALQMGTWEALLPQSWCCWLSRSPFWEWSLHSRSAILMDDASRAGNVSGNVYAISTSGSFIGTILPTLIFIPLIGTTRTFLFFSFVLLAVALVGLYLTIKRGVLPYLLLAIALAALALWGLNTSIKRTPGQVFETESAYNYIEVLQSGGYTYSTIERWPGGALHLSSDPDRVRRDPEEQEALRSILVVTVSRFFRNAKAFHFLSGGILPRLAEKSRPVAWSAGCASGEEPYSVRMAWEEMPGEKPGLLLLATDVDPACLERAEAGWYPESSLRELPPELRRKYFTREGNLYRVCEAVRRSVEFRRLDLLRDPPPGRFDLILCRNAAFTYFGPGERLGVARRLPRRCGKADISSSAGRRACPGKWPVSSSRFFRPGRSTGFARPDDDPLDLSGCLHPGPCPAEIM